MHSNVYSIVPSSSSAYRPQLSSRNSWSAVGALQPEMPSITRKRIGAVAAQSGSLGSVEALRAIVDVFEVETSGTGSA